AGARPEGGRWGNWGRSAWEPKKQLSGGAFVDPHRPSEPAQLRWPVLDDDALALLRSLPFWTHALQAEEDAGPMITACAALEPDLMVRQALELQAFEEARHARIIKHMIELYGLHADEVHVEIPADVLQAFIDFGLEECLDSFGAFGLFKLAREHLSIPAALFDIFDQVMQEEATHIVFFLNWFAYHQATRGLVPRAFRHPKALRHYLRALRKLAGLASGDTPDGKDFIIKAPTPSSGTPFPAWSSPPGPGRTPAPPPASNSTR